MSNKKSANGEIKSGRRPGTTVPGNVLSTKLSRLLAGKTLAESGEIMGVTGEGARRYLNGSRLPDVGVASALHASTGVDLNWLLNDADEREGPVYVRKRSMK